jgi:hypothetical protein
MLHRLGRYRCRHRQYRPLPPLRVWCDLRFFFSSFHSVLFAIVGGLIFTVGHTHFGRFAECVGHRDTLLFLLVKRGGTKSAMRWAPPTAIVVILGMRLGMCTSVSFPNLGSKLCEMRLLGVSERFP